MKITFFPFQPHCFAYGGFDLQMLNAFNSLKKLNVSVSKFDLWETNQNFDIVHLWGISPHNYQIIDWSKKCNKIVVATLLLPYYDKQLDKIKYFARLYCSRAFKNHLKYFSKIDRFSVVNEIQKLILHKYYFVPLFKIDIIPNIVEDKFFTRPKIDFSLKYNITNYVLCTGNISARKNQLNLAKACTNLNLNLVLIGNILDGEITYATNLQNFINSNSNILWIKNLPNASEDLIAAYYGSLFFALPSNEETQPISALEASTCGKKCLFIKRKYAFQKYYDSPILSISESVKDIELALFNALNSNKTVSSNPFIYECKEFNVGNDYLKFYNNSYNF